MVMNENRRFRDSIYEQLARIGKAVASPKRLELLDLLVQGPRTVEALAEETGMTVANASRHLQLLRSARLVEAGKEGLYVRYRLADEAVGAFLRGMRTLADKRLAEIDQIVRQFLKDHEDLEPVDLDTLLERLSEGAVIVLDVRPQEEYRAGHIPGAISIPLKELEGRLDELPRDREVVAYCRGHYCILAIEAVEVLRTRGFSARYLEDGVLDWRLRGLDVAVGENPL